MTRIFLVVVFALCTALPGFSANDVAVGQSSGPHGGAFPLPLDEMTDAERQRIEQATAASIAELQMKGLIAPPSATSVQFDWPVVQWNGLNNFGMQGISNYVDQNPSFPDQLLDYFCGQRTYDLSSGYNHRGTDIFSWPNSWLYMNKNKIAIVAAAPGTIVFKDDGHFDMSCGFNNNPWNAVYVQHADGSIAWYGHLKSGSLTSKNVGQTVVTGEYLGIMGSSGSSTGPHLHFEVWENQTYSQLLDPWDGACNTLNPSPGSMWLSQEAYRVPGVNDLTVGATNPTAPTCPGLEQPNEQYDHVFVGSQAIYFTMYLRDQLLNVVTDLAILRPDGTTWQSWQHVNNGDYSASWWWWWWMMPDSPAGTWTFQVTFDGQTYQQKFNIGIAASGAVPTTLTVDRGPSNRILLDWEDSCRSSDSDYVIYEGAIGDYTVFEQKSCSTSGETSAIVVTPDPDRFWVVGPRNANRQGSTGVDSDDVPRPEPAPTEICVPSLIDAC